MCNSLEGLINRRPELREPAKAHYDSCAYDKFLHNPPLTKEEVGLRSTMREGNCCVVVVDPNVEPTVAQGLGDIIRVRRGRPRSRFRFIRRFIIEMRR